MILTGKLLNNSIIYDNEDLLECDLDPCNLESYEVKIFNYYEAFKISGGILFDYQKELWKCTKKLTSIIEPLLGEYEEGYWKILDDKEIEYIKSLNVPIKNNYVKKTDLYPYLLLQSIKLKDLNIQLDVKGDAKYLVRVTFTYKNLN